LLATAAAGLGQRCPITDSCLVFSGICLPSMVTDLGLVRTLMRWERTPGCHCSSHRSCHGKSRDPKSKKLSAHKYAELSDFSLARPERFELPPSS
jgi:hypothetical protein